MARMAPQKFPPTAQSSAEGKIFAAIRTTLDNDWMAIHSLGLTGHRTKPWAEIDFVLIGPAGIFCLEVKGGRISRENGLWRFTNRHGNSAVKSEGPFDQVGSASAALHAHLVDRLPGLAGAIVGYGVVTPDVTFSVVGPDIINEVVYDENDTRKPFSAYVKRLSAFWSGRLRKPIEYAGLSASDVQAVLDALRGDFELEPSLGALIRKASDELVRLTEAQMNAFAGLEENERILIRGAAGTGKTLLAVLAARRLAKEGAKVFYCCFNRRLAEYVGAALADCDSAVDVFNLHRFMADVLTESGRMGYLPPAPTTDLLSERLGRTYPSETVNGLLDLDRVQTYDVLIVDEAQDLMSDPYLDVMDAVLHGGLSNGRWFVFYDPHQDLFKHTDRSAFSRLTEAHPAQFKLRINCRNTDPVATSVAVLSGVERDSLQGTDGPQVESCWYRDEDHEQRAIGKCINRLLSEGVRSEGIVVLSRRKLENSCLRSGLVGTTAVVIDFDRDGASPGGVRFSTIAAFKGLEADAVLLVDVDDLEHADALLAAYVGASRANTFLAVFFNEAVRPAYEANAVKYGEWIAKQRK